MDRGGCQPQRRTGEAALRKNLPADGRAAAPSDTPRIRHPAKHRWQGSPACLPGTWKQTNGNDKDHYQQATVTADKIEINWISPDSTSLYWSGSFTAPTKAGDSSWTSKGDKEKMASSLLASQDESKDFKYANGEITYSASALGTTTTVRLKKQ